MKPEMKNNFLLKSALALAIVDLVLIAAILLQVNNLVKGMVELQNKQTEVEGMKERLENLDAQVVDVDFDVSKWMVYQNQDFSFEFKHPKTWKVNQIGSSYLDLAKNQLALFAIEDPASPLRNVGRPCTISIYENKNSLYLKDWIDDRYKAENIGVGAVISKTEPFTLSDGKEGQKVYISGSNASRTVSIYLPFDSKIYGFSYATQFETDKVSTILKNKDICERIASTYFKFTD